MRDHEGEKIMVSDLQALRQALGASVQDMAAVIGLEPNFVRAHESTTLPMPKTVLQLLRYVTQGLDMNSGDSPHSHPLHPYLWCEPECEDDQIYVPMVYGTRYPRVNAPVLTPKSLQHFKTLFSDGVPIYEMTLDGQTWWVAMMFLDVPIHPTDALVKNVMDYAAKKIREGRIPYV